jgi:hypothetical protein
MKTLLIVLASAISLYTIYPNDTADNWYVVLKFEQSGKLMQLSPKFDSHYQCVSSADYQLHNQASQTSHSNIQCTNTKPDYTI